MPSAVVESSLVIWDSTRRQLDMTDRRACRVPNVPAEGGGRQPRSLNQDGCWRKKRADAGKKRN